MRDDLTAIYYSAHLEDPATEAEVRRTHLGSLNGLPVISVTQQPLDFGMNICVGDVGVSDINAFRQFELGIRAAETKYICNIEADFVYPPEYFQVVPPTDDTVYVANPMYVLFAMVRRRRRFYRKPGGSEGAIVVARDYMLHVFEKMLTGCPQWSREGVGFLHMWKIAKHHQFPLKVPVVTFKTDKNMGRKTPYIPSSERVSLPYWGTVHEVLQRFHLPEHVSCD